MTYAQGYRDGHLDRFLGFCSDYAFYGNDSYSQGYRDGVKDLPHK